MESINTRITSAELYRKHNINLMAFTRWRESFVKSGKSALSGKVRETTQSRLSQKKMNLSKNSLKS